MALTETAMELASSLSQNEIPIKLRCAICNRLATNAVRLPCCDQSICQSCHSTLPESCLVCEHSPLSADDCKPNKALRLTVKAFLKSEEKKRDKGRSGANASKDPQQEQAASNAVLAENGASKEETVNKGHVESNTVPNTANETNAPEIAINSLTSPQAHDKVNGHHDSPDADMVNNNQSGVQSARTGAESGGYGDNVANECEKGRTEGLKNLGPSDNENTQQSMQFQRQQNYDGMQIEHNDVEWPTVGGYNTMLQSQNGMPNANWNWMTNMMGMTGVDMDPMAMAQGFLGGFGSQGMGLNGMANGINMNTMGFEGGFGRWQDQQGMGMNGEFGTDAGYYSNSGYNPHHFQGHPYHRMQFQNSQSTSFQNKNYIRGRGRGFMHNNSNRGLPNRYRGGHVNPRGFNESRSSVANQQNASPQHVAFQHGQGAAFINQLPAGLQDGRPTDQSLELAEAYRKQDMIINMHKGGDLPNADAKSLADSREGDSNIAGISGDVSLQSGADSLPIALAANEASKTGISVGMAGESDGAGQNDEQMNMQITPMESTYERVDPEYPHNEATSIGRDMNGDMAAMSFNIHQMQHFPGAAGYRGSFRGRGNFSRGRGGRGGYSDYRGNFRGRFGHAAGFSAELHGAGYNESGLSEPVGRGVEGAPTGPKAMREGISQQGFRGKDAQKGSGRQDMPPPGLTNSMEENRQSRGRRISTDANGLAKGAEKEHRSRSMSSNGRHQRQCSERRNSENEDLHDRSSDRRSSNVENNSTRNATRSTNRDRSRSPDYSGNNADRQSSRREREKYRSSKRYRESSASNERRERKASPPTPSRNYDEKRSRKARDEKLDEDSGRRRARSNASSNQEEHMNRSYDRASAQDRDRDWHPEQQRERHLETDQRRHKISDREQGFGYNERDRKRSKRDREDSPYNYSDDDRRRRRSKRSKRDESYHPHRDHDDVEHTDGCDVGSNLPSSKRENQENPSPVEIEFKIKDRSKKSRRPSSPSHQNGLASPAIPTGPAAAKTSTTRKSSTTADPHTLEREARDRERLLKEVQRRQQSSQKQQQQRSSKHETQQVQPQMRSIQRSPPPIHAPTGPAADKKKSGTTAAAAPLPPTEPSALRRSRKDRKRESRDEFERSNGNGSDYNDNNSDGQEHSKEKENSGSSVRRRERHRHSHTDRHDKADRKERRRKSHRRDGYEQDKCNKERGEEENDRDRDRDRDQERDRDRDGASKRKNRDKDKGRDRGKGRSGRRAEIDEARTRRVESEREAARWR